MRNTVTQATRNSADARMYPSAKRVATVLGARTPAGGEARPASCVPAGVRASGASRDPAGGRAAAASRDPAAASRAKPAATNGSASSEGRSPNESGIAAAPAGTASTWPAIKPAPHSAAATANQRYARRDGPA